MTGIYIRAKRPNGSWGNYDIADRELPEGELIGWLVGHGANAFSVRLIGVLLDRPLLKRFGL